MSGYVIRRKEDGWYVRPSGSDRAYSKHLAKARVFDRKSDADHECCGNERVERVEDQFGG